MINFFSLILILLVSISASFIFYYLVLFLQKTFGINALNIKKKIANVVRDLESQNTPKLFKSKNESNLNIKNNFFYRHISKLIYTSGSDLTFQQIISKRLLLFILSFVITKILGMYFLISFFIALIFSCYPIINLIIKRKKRLLKFDEQLPDALDFISRALAAGHSLT